MKKKRIGYQDGKFTDEFTEQNQVDQVILCRKGKPKTGGMYIVWDGVNWFPATYSERTGKLVGEIVNNPLKNGSYRPAITGVTHYFKATSFDGN